MKIGIPSVTFVQRMTRMCMESHLAMMLQGRSTSEIEGKVNEFTFEDLMMHIEAEVTTLPSVEFELRITTN